MNKCKSEGDNNVISIINEEKDSLKISGADVVYQDIKNEEENSDLGILDELQKLEQEGTLSKKPKITEKEAEQLSTTTSFENNFKPPVRPSDEERLESTSLADSGRKIIPLANSKSHDELGMDIKMVSEDEVVSEDDGKLQPCNDVSESKREEQEVDIELKTSFEQKYSPEDTYHPPSSGETSVVSRTSVDEPKKVKEDEHLPPSGESLVQLSAEESHTSSSPSVEKKPEPFVLPTPLSLIPLPDEPLPQKDQAISASPFQSPFKKESPSMVTSSPISFSSSFPISSVVTKSDDDDMKISSDEKENIVPDEDSMEISPPPPPPPLPPPPPPPPPFSLFPEEKCLKEGTDVIKELTPEEMREKDLKNKQIVEERMKTFELLEENLYLSERVKSKRSKDAKRMVCDCSLSKEELGNNEMGCGDDCINKLLMIECGSRCPLKEQCMNKNFQRRNYAPVEVFNAEEKGCGVRACQDIPVGSFIMEYVGEVFDTREFKRRRREYAKGSSAHFYFMALRSDRLIDATRKGNISRFINHSCSPNAETQKWTVNGDVRIGFFATQHISAGEEINFDYRLERYGREPQKCFCGTPQCRGWLGEPPDQKTKEEKEEDRRRQIRDRQRREGKRAIFEDMDLDDEIEKLRARGLRNRQDTLTLSRLMVRCEDADSRLVLLKILGSGEEASRRLFLDYHGLKLLWSWMVDISSSHKCNRLKVEILKTLSCLPITNRTQVTDSKILSVVERWSKAEKKEEDAVTGGDAEKGSSPPPPPRSYQERKMSSDGSEDSEDAEGSEGKSRNGEVVASASTASPVEDSSSQEDSNELPISSGLVPPVSQQPEGEGEIKSPSEPDDGRSSDSDKNLEGDFEEVRSLATQLLQVWRALKEAFRIPKKERIEMMKEHERAVEKEYAEFLHSERHVDSEDRTQAFYDRWRYSSSDREKQKERERRRDKWRSRRREDDDEKGLSKEERRERFAMQVAKEDEEARQRKLQEEMWTLHLERCALLEHDPYYTPIFDPSGQYYWDPGAKSWQPYVGPSGNLPVPASYGMTANSSIEGVCPTASAQNQSFLPGAFFPLPPNNAPESQPGGIPEGDSLNLDPASIPLPGESVSSESPAESSVKPAVPHSQEAMDITVEPVNGIDTPPLAPPGPVTIQLPSQWKLARDGDRRIYFYHVKTRHTQWELPQENQHQVLLAQYGLDSDSESDLESDSDSSSSSDSEDFSSDEEEEEEEEEQTEVSPVQTAENFDEKMIRRPKGKKVRSEKLVQERVISPILFEDREAARRERKEAKERAREEARKERWQLLRALKGGITVTTGASTGKGESDFGFMTISEDTVVSPNDNDEDDEHLEEQLTRFSRKQKSEGKSSSSSHTKGKSKERAATAMADTSDLARKIKDNFRSRMATYIVSVLNPYRKPDCTEGRITSNEDFKYLARKLTHFVMVKELKQLPSIDGLDCSESVKHKTKEFVRKYMGKYGGTFKRDPNDTKEY